MRHDELKELTGAYALDAVEANESDEIERHLPGCPQCRSEVAELREVAASLGVGPGPRPSGSGTGSPLKSVGADRPWPRCRLCRPVVEATGRPLG